MAASCRGRTVTIVGTAAADVIVGTAGDDVIDALAGDDVVRGLEGYDIVCSGEGDDVIYLARSPDEDSEVRAGPGDDVIHGRGVHLGGPGNDVIYGGQLGDTVRPGPGDDVVYGRGSIDFFRDGPGDDVYFGGRWGEVITLAAGGRDLFLGGSGAGGQLRFSAAVTHSVYVNLTTGRVRGTGKDTVEGISHVVGTPYDDILIGNARWNHILARGGADRIEGRAGRDLLSGGAGRDFIAGGAGRQDRCTSAATVRCELS
jgi:Ca2+-binding RTX toxin-like protein